MQKHTPLTSIYRGSIGTSSSTSLPIPQITTVQHTFLIHLIEGLL